MDKTESDDEVFFGKVTLKECKKRIFLNAPQSPSLSTKKETKTDDVNKLQNSVTKRHKNPYDHVVSPVAMYIKSQVQFSRTKNVSFIPILCKSTKENKESLGTPTDSNKNTKKKSMMIATPAQKFLSCPRKTK